LYQRDLKDLIPLKTLTTQNYMKCYFHSSLENTFLTDRYEFEGGKFYFIQTNKQNMTHDSFDRVKLFLNVS
jgi:hypothetical protein